MAKDLLVAGCARVAFVTHGGAAVGLGHVKRCAALGRTFAGSGTQVVFLASLDAGARVVLERTGLEVVEASWETDGAVALERVKAFGADVAVVDSYVASPDLLRSLRLVAGQVVAVDDLADRSLPVHIVVNGGLAAERLRYRGSPDTVYLLGPRYALVDPDYATLPERPVPERVRRVLVSLGGGPDGGALRAAVAAVDAALEGVTIDVAPGTGAPADLASAPRRSSNRVVVYPGFPELRELIREADLAVAGAGMTLYELAVTGTPTVTITMAENQSANAAAFSDAVAALSAGVADDAGLATRLESHLRRLAGDAALRADLARRARSLVDGRGALRVVQATMRMAGSTR